MPQTCSEKNAPGVEECGAYLECVSKIPEYAISASLSHFCVTRLDLALLSLRIYSLN